MELMNSLLQENISSHPTENLVAPVREIHRGMSEEDKKILTKNLNVLCTDMNPMGILLALQSDEIIGQFDIPWIQEVSGK
jgi:hypothetical protein